MSVFDRSEVAAEDVAEGFSVESIGSIACGDREAFVSWAQRDVDRALAAFVATSSPSLPPLVATERSEGGSAVRVGVSR